MKNKREKHIIKKSEMKTDITYILCPDENCDIFFNEKKHCTSDCPHPDKARQLDYCGVCNNFYENEINFSLWQRKDHRCNHHGLEWIGSKFYTGKWILIHEYPKEE